MKYKSSTNIQKLYDEAYRSCATAVYFESRENEDEALRCWRIALAKIQGCTRTNGGGGSGGGSSSGSGFGGRRSSAQTETERSLIDSLHQLELRCQERVELYDTLRLSREEEQRNRDVITAWNGGDPHSQRPPVSSSSSSSSLPRGPRPAPSTTSLQRIQRTSSSSERPPHDPDPLESGIAPAAVLSREPLPPNAVAQPVLVGKRTQSPEKKGFLTTLRPSIGSAKNSAKAVPRLKAHTGHGVAAAKAASRAWSSTGRVDRLDPTFDDAGPSHHGGAFSMDAGGIPRRESASNSATDLRLQTTYSQSSSSTVDPGGPERRYSPISRPQERRWSRKDIEFGQASYPDAENFSDSDSLYTTYPERPPPRPPKTPIKGPGPRPDSVPYGDFKERIPPSMLAERVSSMNLGNNNKGRGDALVELDAGPVPFHEANGYGRKDKRVPERPVEAKTSEVEGAGFGSYLAPTYSKDDDDADEITLNTRFKQVLKDYGRKIDSAAAHQIINEIVVHGDEVHWDDIAGLDAAKLALKEAVVYPFLRPDLFSGLREPARGILLFGPAGTGKTMLAKTLATESKSTFFSISASSLTSKYLGESEKLVRTLFTLAKALAPSIIFVDEIDSLLSSRNSGGDTEATTRIKTEFLIQWSDLARAAAGRKVDPGSGDPTRVLVLAATNVPWAIDEAARRRFVRRQYIPLPEGSVRVKQLRTLLSHQNHDICDDDLKRLETLTDGFSGSDITALAKDAAMGPLRNLGDAILHMPLHQIRPIGLKDFIASLGSIRPSVSREGLQRFEDWATQFGERV